MRKKSRLSCLFILILFSAALLTASQAVAMRFSHILHEKNEISQCARCHTPGAVTIIPERTVCSECHGSDLGGSTGIGAPNLALVIAYSLDDFRELMHTGVPIGDRKLDLMEEVAIGRFSRFTDLEIENLHAYLQTLASRH